MPYKVIQVGTGGFGKAWCEMFLPPNVADGLIQVVAAVDINPDALENARNSLKLPAHKCYTDINKAFDENKADFCCIVVPPAHHEKVANAAIARGMHILSEKPIADSLEASVRIANKIKAAGRKMGVTMSHRFAQQKYTLRTQIHSGEYGPLDYLIMRFTCDCRKFASWGKFRHEIPDPLMVEGAVHHLDLLADMAGAKCDTIYARTWNPAWGEFAGDSQALAILTFENGTKVFYEAAKTNAVGMNCWGREYIRAECRDATLILNYQRVERFVHNPSQRLNEAKDGQGEEVPLLQQPKWANAWLIEKFVKWLDGGEPMETNVEDNLQSVALVFAGIESSRTGQPVKVQDFLAKTRRKVEKS